MEELDTISAFFKKEITRSENSKDVFYLDIECSGYAMSIYLNRDYGVISVLTMIKLFGGSFNQIHQSYDTITIEDECLKVSYMNDASVISFSKRNGDVFLSMNVKNL